MLLLFGPPYKKGDIEAIEKIQKRATKLVISVTGHWSERALVRRVTGPKGHWSEGYGVGIHCREVVRIEANTPLSVSQTIILVLHVSLSHTLILI